MATWTTPPTFTSTTLTAADLNTLIGAGGNIEWLKNALAAIGITADSGLQTVDSAVAGCRVYNSAAISIPTATWTALTFNSERFDLYDDAASTYHSTVSNTGRITIPAGLGGYYLIGGHVEFAASTTNRRGIRIVHSVAATVIASEEAEAVASDHTMSLVTFYALAATEYVTLEVWQNSGGALNVLAAGNYSPEFWAVRVGV